MGAASALDEHGKKQSQAFSYTGLEQTFTVPNGVTAVDITVSGASGAVEPGSGPSIPGGVVTATLPVTRGELLAVYVGGQGGIYGSYYGFGGLNGECTFENSSHCNTGGGASYVRQGGDGLVNHIVAAAGGSNQGYEPGGGIGPIGDAARMGSTHAAVGDGQVIISWDNPR